MTKNRVIIAQEEVGYELNPARSYFALVAPEDSVNLVYNPECYDTDGYTAINAAVSASSSVQRRGASSLYVQPSAVDGGVRCNLTALAADRHYTFSVDVRSSTGGMIAIHFGDANGVRLGEEVVFYAPTFWLRQSVTIFTASLAVRSLVVRSVDDVNFYADGFQLEDKPYATTFISGNIEAQEDLAVPGRLHYGWMGPPHRSASFRTRFARSGGRPIPLHELGLQVTDFSGFGYAAPEVVTAALALRSDRVYRGAFAPERQFVIGGFVQGSTLLEVLRKRKALGYQAYGTEAEPTPVTLQVQFHDDLRPLHEMAEIECVYMGGLEGSITNLHQEKVMVTFKALRPFLRLDGNRGAALNISSLTHNSPATVIYTDGTVDALPDGGVSWTDDDLPMRMALGIDGLLYMTAGDSLWRFTRSVATQVLTRTNGKIKDVLSGPDGWLFYIYEDDDDGGQTGGIAAYDPRNGGTSTLGTVVFATNSGTNLEMWRLRYDNRTNRLYVCGNFGRMSTGGVWQQFDGVEPTGIVYLDLEYGLWGGFPELSSTAYDTRPYAVRDCAPSPGGLWVVGSFYSANGPSTWARWSDVAGAWEFGQSGLGSSEIWAPAEAPLGHPAASGPYCCVYEPRYNQLYVGGNFSDYLFVSHSTGLYETFRLGYGICVIDCMGSFINRVNFGVAQRSPHYTPYVTDLALSPDGKRVYVTGQFSEVVTTTSSELWPSRATESYQHAPGVCAINVDSGAWEPLGLTMPSISMAHTVHSVPYADSVIAPPAAGANSAYGSLATPAYTQWYGDMNSANIVNNRGATYISHSDLGATSVSPVTTVRVGRGARALVRLEVTGPCRLRRIINATSGAAMQPEMVIGSGETRIFSFAPGPVWVRSTTVSKVDYRNLGKDAWPDLHFVAGDNNIVLDLKYSAGAKAVLYWREEYAAVEALLP